MKILPVGTALFHADK